ncbi:2,3-diaminopropionate biosynthesis protein SbnB [Kitasatospora sp. NBC_00458]|uniref:2,3-diaminopropionate biosynthesis protein SbnB n=1 Tax=Kitasatospora sp. NBC_00458 TaxID=2903568 RepID=UPI002E19E60E
MFTFQVMGGKSIRAIIETSRPEIFARVRETYLAHHRGATINPNSYFLRFPEKPDARIIALPAALRADGDADGGPAGDANGGPGDGTARTGTARTGVAGIKWIGSFPGNVAHNVPRASAVLLLNDLETGYPFACLEAAQISAARTAASAVLGAEQLHGSRTAGRLAVVGAGVISRNILEFFHALGWSFDRVAVHDRVEEYARKSAGHAGALGYRTSVHTTLAGAVDGADVVVLATTAATPYIVEPGALAPGQTVLNISLRDIGPELIAASHNVVDDVGHCLNAGTSPHLAVEKFGHRDFIDGTIAQLVLGELPLGPDKPRIFSPFGLGVLDLAVGHEVLRIGREDGRVQDVPDFFAEVERW